MTRVSGEQPATRWGDREQRRADILRVGDALLTSGGYEALRMRNVAAGADISLGTVYTYFMNKESLFIAIFAKRLDTLSERLTPAIAAADDAVEAFVLTAAMYRDDYLVFGRQFDALNMDTDVDEVQDDVADLLRSATDRMTATLASSLHRFGYRGDIAPAMTLLWVTIRGLVSHYANPRSQFLVVPWDVEVRFAAEALARSLGLSSPD